MIQPAPSPAVHCQGLSYRYAPPGGGLVLDQLNLSIARGEQALIVGPSGSGKTTLLAVLAGLIAPTSGTVQIAGVDLGAISGTARDAFRARHIGLVPQRAHLISALSVLDNLLLAQRLAGLSSNQTALQARLAALGVAHRAHAKPAALSAGEAQRVLVVRATLHQPALLLADEPTSALDDANAQTVLDLLTTAATQAGAALLIVTHDARLIQRLPVALTLTLRGTP